MSAGDLADKLGDGDSFGEPDEINETDDFDEFGVIHALSKRVSVTAKESIIVYFLRTFMNDSFELASRPVD